MNDFISVIVPIYNSAHYLDRCITSILEQSFSNLEVILVDDGSIDNSLDICKKYEYYDKRVKVIHQNNLGSSVARNNGLYHATGNFVSFVDSDDWIETDIYQYCLEIYKSTKSDIIDFECIYANEYKRNSKNDKELSYIVYKGKDIIWNYFERGLSAKKSAPYSACRKLYTRKIIDNIRFLENRKNEDMIFNYQVLKKTSSITITNKIGYYYFQNSNSNSNGQLKMNDLDIFYACEYMYENEKGNTYKGTNNLALAKYARSDFSVLARIARDGCSSEINKNVLVKKLTKRLRSNWLFLMKSPIPFNRKMLISIMCVDYRLLSLPNRILKEGLF